MNKDLRIQECIDNHEQYVAQLATMPDKKLAEKLDIIHLQMKLAEEQKNTSTIELLEIWRAQTIEARTYKAENNIPDTASEIEIAIADIETVIVKTDERREILNGHFNPTKQRQPKVNTEQDKDSQLSLF